MARLMNVIHSSLTYEADSRQLCISYSTQYTCMVSYGWMDALHCTARSAHISIVGIQLHLPQVTDEEPLAEHGAALAVCMGCSAVATGNSGR